MLTLYHMTTAVCAAKVRVVLAEKSLEYESRPIDLHKGDQFRPEYLKLNPNAVVPTLVHDGEVLIESTVINEYLDEVFPEPSLRPKDSARRAHMRVWTKREDSIHDMINTMTASILFRHDLLQKPPEEREKRFAAMPDPARRAKWREMLDKGLASPIVIDALVRFARFMHDQEAALKNGPWLAGDDFTLADAGFMSFFYRLELLECAPMWEDHFPRVSSWWERCKQRPSFRTAIGDFISPEALAHYHEVAAPQWPRVQERYREALERI